MTNCAAFAPIRQYIATFDNSNYLSALPNGEVCVANNWSGDCAVAKARAAEATRVADWDYDVWLTFDANSAIVLAS